MAVKVADVPAVLARHGVPPDVDAETLTRAITARGWPVTVEETWTGRARRYTAHATRVRHNPRPYSFPIIRRTVRATGPTPRAALAFALAKALEKEWET